MRRKKSKLPQSHDSDQSISEEEEEWYDNVRGDCISLGGSSEKKGQVQVLSQLEKLRGSTTTSQKGETSISILDDIGMQVSDNQGDFACLPRKLFTHNSDEENISDDEVKENNMLLIESASLRYESTDTGSFPGLAITRKDEERAWSEAAREVEELVHQNENGACSSFHAGFSKVNRSCKGGRGKVKPRFSFHSRSHKGDVSWTHRSSQTTPFIEESESIEHGLLELSKADEIEVFREVNIEQSDIRAVQIEVAVEQYHTEHSMADILDSFQENKSILGGNSKVFSGTKERRLPLAIKKSISSLEDMNMDFDSQTPEELDSEQSSDNEGGHQNLQLVIHEPKQKTMADQFQEAFRAASTRDDGILFALPKHSGSGLFGKLQRVLQNEKERDMDFTKRFQTQDSLKGIYFDVRILSRSLEAKLTVCSCSFIQQKESSELEDTHQKERKIGGTSTVIFSSRLCSDVELEVGNLIRIYQPWKEARIIAKDETMILATYFSHSLECFKVVGDAFQP